MKSKKHRPSVEENILNISRKELSDIISFNKKMRKLGMEFLENLPSNLHISNAQESVILIFLFRSLENLSACEILVTHGYLSQAGSLVANSIELMLISKKIKKDPKYADEWVKGQRWAITGRYGLSREFNLVKLEKIYSDFSSMKHTQSMASGLNVISQEGLVAYGSLWSSKLAHIILSSNLTAVGDVIADTFYIFRKNLEEKEQTKWENKFKEFRSEVKKYYQPKVNA